MQTATKLNANVERIADSNKTNQGREHGITFSDIFKSQTLRRPWH